jgi:hypothetical protein
MSWHNRTLSGLRKQSSSVFQVKLKIYCRPLRVPLHHPLLQLTGFLIASKMYFYLLSHSQRLIIMFISQKQGLKFFNGSLLLSPEPDCLHVNTSSTLQPRLFDHKFNIKLHSSSQPESFRPITLIFPFKMLRYSSQDMSPLRNS